MIIANPIYDTAFKRLLENDRAAKFLIGTILDCKVLVLEPNIQEHTVIDEESKKISLFRICIFACVAESSMPRQNLTVSGSSQL